MFDQGGHGDATSKGATQPLAASGLRTPFEDDVLFPCVESASPSTTPRRFQLSSLFPGYVLDRAGVLRHQEDLDTVYPYVLTRRGVRGCRFLRGPQGQVASHKNVKSQTGNKTNRVHLVLVALVTRKRRLLSPFPPPTTKPTSRSELRAVRRSLGRDMRDLALAGGGI